MIQTWKRRYYEPYSMGCGPFVETTIESLENNAILLGNSYLDSKFVIYGDEIDGLIEALQELRKDLK